MDDISRVKQKIGVEELLGEYITLKKTGRNFKGLCPFHGEKTPSFIVSPDRGIWRCFGCAKSGDIFTFLEEYEKLDFGDSLRMLADRAGITLTGSYKKTDTEKKKEKIYTLNSLAAQFYHYLLIDHSIGKDALSYLIDTRKIPLGLIKKFQLGYAPAGSLLSRFLLQKKKQHPLSLLDAGLVSEKNGRTFDFFRNRIMFPITDARENIIAFSGRALDNTTLPKYVNTRETLVYKKGDTLFGLSFAKDDIKKEGKVIVVEGEFDVISAFHEGIKNIVAVKGTALTESQIKVLKRFAAKITFCFDTDPAGTAAQRRSIELIEKEGVLASVIVPPHGKDPDELLHEDPIAFKKAIKDDQSIYEFIITSSIQNLNVENPEDKRQILEKTLPFLMNIENEVIKEHYLKKLATLLDTSYDSLLKQGEKTIAPFQKAPPPPPQPVKTREERTEEYLLSLLLQATNPSEYCSLVQEVVSQVTFSIPAYNRLFETLAEFCKKNPTFVLSSFVQLLPTELIEVFDRIYLLPLPTFETNEDYHEEVEKTAHEVKLLVIKKSLKDLSDQIKQKEGKINEDEIEALRTEFNRLAQLLK